MRILDVAQSSYDYQLPIFEMTEMSCGMPESMGELGIGLKSGDTIMFTVFDLYIFYSFNL